MLDDLDPISDTARILLIVCVVAAAHPDVLLVDRVQLGQNDLDDDTYTQLAETVQAGIEEIFKQKEAYRPTRQPEEAAERIKTEAEQLKADVSNMIGEDGYEEFKRMYEKADEERRMKETLEQMARERMGR